MRDRRRLAEIVERSLVQAAELEPAQERALFEALELTKGHRPDQNADSLGGTVNLNSGTLVINGSVT